MRKDVKILNQLGLHARPAAEFVRRVEEFDSEVTIWKGEEQFAGSSILGVMTANLRFGSNFVLEATGTDAEKALDSIGELLHEFKRQEDEEPLPEQPSSHAASPAATTEPL